jgi:hypothetical protein
LVTEKVLKNKKVGKNKTGFARMVLLENFGAEPLTVNLRRPNCGKFVGLLLRRVTQRMTPGIPKFRRESHPERARIKGPPIFSQFLNGYILPFPQEFDNLG